jgi:hypothetical protein
MAVRNHSPKATSPSSRPRASVKRQALNAKPYGQQRIPCSGSQIARLTDGMNVKSLSDAAAYPLFATPDGLRKDRFTNVAAVRRCVRIKSEFAGTPWSFAWRTGVAAKPRARETAMAKTGKNCRFLSVFALGKVDRNGDRTLYRSSWVRRRLGALARPRSPSLFTR